MADELISRAAVRAKAAEVAREWDRLADREHGIKERLEMRELADLFRKFEGWVDRLPAAPEPVSADKSMPMVTEPPKDGTMVCLLVDYSGDGAAPLEDALTGWTIGYNTLADTGDDEWIMVGWDWCQDCYCEGRGKIIGWAPFAPTIHQPTDRPEAP